MRLHLSCLHLGGIHVMTVKKIDSLCHHLHMTKLLCGDIKKEILNFGILDSEALRHILHCRLELTVTAAKLLLKQYGILWIRSFDLYGMK